MISLSEKKDNKNVVKMDTRKNMKTIIEAAKEKAEREFNEKMELASRSDIDIREVFTAEEFDELCRRNENFKGTKADFSKVQMHKKLAMAAKWLYEHSIEVVWYDVEPISKAQPNAIVVLEVHRLSSLRKQELQVFSAMAAMADQMFISGMKEDVIRFSFGVERVWDER